MQLKAAEDRTKREVTGPVFETQVTKIEGIDEEIGDQTLSLGEVVFAPGERTKVHTHTIRQILFVTGGEGVVVTDETEFEVSENDIVSIPPDEKHWHGATEESEFRHVSVVVRDEEHGGTIALDE